MAASSTLPRRARGTPGWTGRPGEEEGWRRSAAATWTRGPRRCAQRSRTARQRAQVSLRPAHFKRANQRRPLKGGGASEDAPALPEVALVSWETDAERVRGVWESTRPRWSRDFPRFPMRKLRVCVPTAAPDARRGAHAGVIQKSHRRSGPGGFRSAQPQPPTPSLVFVSPHHFGFLSLSSSPFIYIHCFIEFLTNV